MTSRIAAGRVPGRTSGPPAPGAQTDGRVTAFYGAMAVAALILLGQLWRIQIDAGTQYRQRADTNRIRVVTDKPLRGVVYDRAGRQLVHNVPSFSVSIRPADLPKDDAGRRAIFERLGQVIETPPDDIAALVAAAR